MTINASFDKELCQIYKGYSFFNKQTIFVLRELIHKNDRIKMLGFAEPTIPGTCGFPLANLHFAESVDVVP